MRSFIITPSIDSKTNKYFLRQNIKAFYHSDYHGGGNWKIDGTIENIITTLKNDITPYSKEILKIAVNRLIEILIEDLSKISKIITSKPLTVCVVPRAKNEDYYSENQKLFRKVISFVIDNKLNNIDFVNGTKYIIRHTNTRTTHRNKSGHGGDGSMPYPGITKETCHISPNVKGKDILLIDDLYTKTINIDEDAIQALIDNGANSVYFYSIGKTVFK
jgi:hypothetical protein